MSYEVLPWTTRVRSAGRGTQVQSWVGKDFEFGRGIEMKLGGQVGVIAYRGSGSLSVKVGARLPLIPPGPLCRLREVLGVGAQDAWRLRK